MIHMWYVVHVTPAYNHVGQYDFDLSAARYDWVTQHVGVRDLDWKHATDRTYSFKHAHHAVEFAMRFT